MSLTLSAECAMAGQPRRSHRPNPPRRHPRRRHRSPRRPASVAVPCVCHRRRRAEPGRRSQHHGRADEGPVGAACVLSCVRLLRHLAGGSGFGGSGGAATTFRCLMSRAGGGIKKPQSDHRGPVHERSALYSGQDGGGCGRCTTSSERTEGRCDLGEAVRAWGRRVACCTVVHT